MKKYSLGLLLAAALFFAGMAVAQRPVQNINASRNPNLAAAQKLVADAFDKITAAQQANRYDMEGHAQKAKNLLLQANQELKLAADWAEKNHK
ncbi:MAG TPA: hypothetical protein VKV05_11325 [Terriglobales bacterium]|nr:hypothetical protein [Terriglobales bacterium]